MTLGQIFYNLTPIVVFSVFYIELNKLSPSAQ